MEEIKENAELEELNEENDEDKEEIKVVDLGDQIKVVAADERYILADKHMELGFKRLIENIRQPKKIHTDQSGQDMAMEFNEYESKKDPDLRIAAKQFVEWDNGEEKETSVSFTKVKKMIKLADLFDEIILELKKINDLPVKDEEEEKND